MHGVAQTGCDGLQRQALGRSRSHRGLPAIRPVFFLSPEYDQASGTVKTVRTSVLTLTGCLGIRHCEASTVVSLLKARRPTSFGPECEFTPILVDTETWLRRESSIGGNSS